jgi:hypothetical protein
MVSRIIQAQAGFKIAWPARGSARFFFDDVVAWKIDDEERVLAITLHGVEDRDAATVIRSPDGFFHRRGHGQFDSEKDAREWCEKELTQRAEAKRRGAVKVFVAFDSPQWRAWRNYRPLGLPELSGTGGWWFDSEWPPTEPAKA